MPAGCAYGVICDSILIIASIDALWRGGGGGLMQLTYLRGTKPILGILG